MEKKCHPNQNKRLCHLSLPLLPLVLSFVAVLNSIGGYHNVPIFYKIRHGLENPWKYFVIPSNTFKSCNSFKINLHLLNYLNILKSLENR